VAVACAVSTLSGGQPAPALFFARRSRDRPKLIPLSTAAPESSAPRAPPLPFVMPAKAGIQSGPARPLPASGRARPPCSDIPLPCGQPMAPPLPRGRPVGCPVSHVSEICSRERTVFGLRGQPIGCPRPKPSCPAMSNQKADRWAGSGVKTVRGHEARSARVCKNRLSIFATTGLGEPLRAQGLGVK